MCSRTGDSSPSSAPFGQIGDQLLREIKRVAALRGDDAGPADPPCRFLGLQRPDFRRALAHGRGRDQRIGIGGHMVDQRSDEARRRQQRIALEIDDQVRLVQLRQRLGAALGAVAAFRRGHDDADAEGRAGIGDPLVIGRDEDAGDAGHAPRRLDAALDQRLGRAVAPFSSTSGLPG